MATTAIKSPFRLFRKHSAPSGEATGDGSSGDSNPILGSTIDTEYRMGSDASSSYNNPEDGNASRIGSEPPSPLPILGGVASPKHTRPSPQITNTVNASSSRFRFSPKTAFRRRPSASTQPTSLALDNQLDDDDDLTEDDVQIVRRNQALRKSVSNEETSRDTVSGLSSPTSAPVVVEPQSPSASFGFGFTSKPFRHSSSKKDKSALPRSYSSRADHRRAVSDQVAMGSDVLNGRKKANSEYDLLPPLPPGIMIGSPSNQSHASHPSRSALSPRMSSSPRTSALAETFQVELVRFYKSGYPTIFFQPKTETESNGYIMDGYRVEVVCVSSTRVIRGEVDLNNLDDEEPLIIIPFGNEKNQLCCHLRLNRCSSSSSTTTMMMMNLDSQKQQPQQMTFIVPLSFGFISCGVIMEAKLNSIFVLELLFVLAVFTALDYFLHRKQNVTSESLPNYYYNNNIFMARSCQVVLDENNNPNNGNLTTIREGSSSQLQQQIVSLLKHEERTCLQLLKDQLSRVEFKDVLSAFSTFYESSEGRKLLKSFAPPGRDNAKYLANAEMLSAKLQEKLEDEDFMIKFLRAEKMRVTPAVKMARKALLLRVGLDLDAIPETHPTLDEYIACSVIAHAAKMSLETHTIKDKAEYRLDNAYVQTLDGHPLLFYRPGKINQRLYFKHAAGGDVGRLGTAMLTTMEAFRRDAAYHHKRTGKPSRIAFAFDLGDFSLSNLVSPFTVLQVSRLTFPVMTTCYPDLVHKLILVNVPSSFLMFWEKLVKPFISESLTSKLIIIGKGQHCVRELRKHVSEDMIPAYLGGKMVGQLEPFKDDEFCRDKVGAVGPYTSDQGISILANASGVRASGAIEKDEGASTATIGSSS